MTPRRHRSESHRFACGVAVTTLLAFGCATVRAPVSEIGPTVPVLGSTAEPQVELWLESAAAPSRAESARAAGDAREALRQALQDRELGGDDVLVVRAQAISRTRSHRSDQRAAIAGLVVGFVALVALAVVASRGRGLSLHGASARAGAEVAQRPAVPVRHVLGPRLRRAGLAPAGASVGVNVTSNVDVDVAVVPDPERGAGGAPPAIDATLAQAPGTDPGALLLPPAERISAVSLPAPPPLVPDHRSFFAGDWVRLELVVVDARTGAARSTKVVTGEVDVRDAREVRRLIDGALATEAGWEAAVVAAP